MPLDPSMTSQWRYRTTVLAGPWRPTVERAAADAITQGKAIPDETKPYGLRWRVPGQIEGDADSGRDPPSET